MKVSKVSYVKKVKPAPNTYLIEIEFEHGDYGSTSLLIHELVNSSNQELQAFLNDFAQFAIAINIGWSEGFISDEIIAEFTKKSIPFELDSYCPNFPARMYLNSVTYYDSNGDEFDVKINWE